MTPHLDRLVETVLMMGRNISFKGVIWKIIPKLSLLPLLNWSTGYKWKALGTIDTLRASETIDFDSPNLYVLILLRIFL